jgi:hypothetical protein
MLRRVNPIMLLGLVVMLILSFGIFARAQLGGGTASDALGVGEAQLGKPFALATDGPNSFSCAGLIRHILRTIGVDGNAPWSAEGMLTAYPAVDPANVQPGDLMLWPNHATMYVGGGMVLNANEVEGLVTHTPVDALGPPMGIVRPPYGGGGQLPAETGILPAETGIPPAETAGLPTEPAAGDPSLIGDPNLMGAPSLAGDPNLIGGDPSLAAGGDPGLGAGGDPGLAAGGDPNLMGGGDPNLMGGGDPNLMGGGDPNLAVNPNMIAEPIM